MTKEDAAPQPWDAESVKQGLMHAIAAERYCRELSRLRIRPHVCAIEAAKRLEWLDSLEPEEGFALSNWLREITRPGHDENSDQPVDARCEAALQEIAQRLNFARNRAASYGC
jgi:hypothetical protein